MSVFQSFSPSESSRSQTDYTTFLREAEQGNIREVRINNSGEIRGTKRSGETFQTFVPYFDDKLVSDLVKNDVRVYGEPPEEQSLLTSIFISWFPVTAYWCMDFLHASNAGWRRPWRYVIR